MEGRRYSRSARGRGWTVGRSGAVYLLVWRILAEGKVMRLTSVSMFFSAATWSAEAAIVSMIFVGILRVGWLIVGEVCWCGDL